MKSNIIKFLLSTTLLIINSSNEVYSAAVEYEELGLNDFTYEYLSSTKNYSVDTNGALFRTDGTKTIYPKYEGQKLYDLQTRINTITNDNKELTNPEGGGGHPQFSCF